MQAIGDATRTRMRERPIGTCVSFVSVGFLLSVWGRPGIPTTKFVGGQSGALGAFEPQTFARLTAAAAAIPNVEDSSWPAAAMECPPNQDI